MFGELVCGPPGSGKTTYCEGKRQFLSVYDATRPVTLLNLDPANEGVFPYPCDVDVREVVDHATVMQDEQLGPNGSYLFCLDVMERNIDWLVQSVQSAVERRVREVLSMTTTTASSSSSPRVRAPYLIIDCPGQVEFYLHSRALHRIVHALQKRLQCSLCTVHLIDASIATRDVSSYVSSCLLCLTTMIDHELPHVNLLSKWDTLHSLDVDNNDNSGAANEADDGNSSGGNNNSTRRARDVLDDHDASVYLCLDNFLGENFDRQWRRQLQQRRRAHRMAQYHVTPQCPVPQLSEAHRRADASLDTVDLHAHGGRLYAYTRSLVSVIEGYGLVGFLPLDVQSQDMMLRVTREIDNAIGNFV